MDVDGTDSTPQPDPSLGAKVVLNALEISQEQNQQQHPSSSPSSVPTAALPSISAAPMESSTQDALVSSSQETTTSSSRESVPEQTDTPPRRQSTVPPSSPSNRAGTLGNVSPYTSSLDAVVSALFDSSQGDVYQGSTQLASTSSDNRAPSLAALNASSPVAPEPGLLSRPTPAPFCEHCEHCKGNKSFAEASAQGPSSTYTQQDVQTEYSML
ncbi:hypothetical protein BDW22DRAFT_1349553 [Trametopsis cervina]|nr:hypothetical protein BDW22DRAFT_1349553 [Trametopsis cervina]